MSTEKLSQMSYIRIHFLSKWLYGYSIFFPFSAGKLQDIFMTFQMHCLKNPRRNIAMAKVMHL